MSNLWDAVVATAAVAEEARHEDRNVAARPHGPGLSPLSSGCRPLRIPTGPFPPEHPRHCGGSFMSYPRFKLRALGAVGCVAALADLAACSSGGSSGGSTSSNSNSGTVTVAVVSNP